MNINDTTLVKLHRNGTCIELSTYSKRFGKHGYFAIPAEGLLEYYRGNRSHPYYNTDCYNFLEMTFYNGKCSIWLTWLSSRSNGRCEGVREYIIIPEHEMVDFMCYSKHDRKLLSCEHENNGTVTFTESAMWNIRNMDARHRRAFCQAMKRGAFLWPDSHTTVYADGKHDFFFNASNGICGGLNLSEYNGRAKYGINT